MISTRVAKAEDINFIYNTWLYSLYNGSDYQNMEKGEFMNAYKNVIHNILTRPGVFTLVACLEDDPDVILGWSCFEGEENPILHYVYVKKLWRGKQIPLMIVPDFKEYTHATRHFLSIKPKKTTYNPFKR